MWKTQRQVQRLLHENNQDHRIHNIMNDIWDLEDNIKSLEQRVRDLETNKKEDK